MNIAFNPDWRYSMGKRDRTIMEHRKAEERRLRKAAKKLKKVKGGKDK